MQRVRGATARAFGRPLSSRVASGLLALLALSSVSFLSAGDVEARLAGKRLVLRGDGGGSDSVIIGQDGDTFSVVPTGDTTVNGSSEPTEFTGVRSLAVKARDLDLGLINVTIEKGVVARLDGDSSFGIVTSSSVGGGVRVGGDGNTQLIITDSAVERGVTFRPRGSQSFLAMTDATIGRAVKGLAKDGVHFAQLVDSTIGRGLTLRRRDDLAGGAVVEITGTRIGRDLSLRGRDAPDELLPINLSGIEVQRNLKIVGRDALPFVSLAGSDVGRSVFVRSRHSTTTKAGAGIGFATSPTTIGRNLIFRDRDGIGAVGSAVPVDIGGGLSLSLGDGDNSILLGLAQFAVGKSASIRTGDGADVIGIHFGPEPVRSLRARLGDGENTLDVDGAIALSVSVRTGDGDDLVDFADAVVGGKFRTKLGGGNDTLIEPGS